MIDGETQPGASANTLANGDNAVLLIEISGAIVTNNGNAFVLVTGASGSTIRGLVIDNGWSTAVLVQTDNIAVEGCFLGTDPTGLIAKGNTQGVNADFGSSASATRVGGTTPAARNVISGNGVFGVGVLIQSGTNSLVQGNFIGTDATGMNALSNGAGVDVRSSDNLIGGTTVAARNVIGANNTGITVECLEPVTPFRAISSAPTLPVPRPRSGQRNLHEWVLRKSAASRPRPVRRPATLFPGAKPVAAAVTVLSSTNGVEQ